MCADGAATNLSMNHQGNFRFLAENSLVLAELGVMAGGLLPSIPPAPF